MTYIPLSNAVSLYTATPHRTASERNAGLMITRLIKRGTLTAKFDEQTGKKLVELESLDRYLAAPINKGGKPKAAK